MRFSAIAIFSVITATLAAPVQLEARDNTAIYAGVGGGTGALALGSLAAYLKFRPKPNVADEATEPLLGNQQVSNAVEDSKTGWMKASPGEMFEAFGEAAGFVNGADRVLGNTVQDTISVYKEVLAAPEKLLGKAVDSVGIKIGQVIGHA